MDSSATLGGDLELLAEFVNTNDIEGGRDAIGTPGLLRDWLAERGMVGGPAAVDGSVHASALAIREGLRALGRANNGEPLDDAQLLALNRVAGALPLVVNLGNGGWSLLPARDGIEGFLARVLATVARASAEDRWSRVKACSNHTCRWLFFDHSRNRSRTWCDMAICGSRMKARAYRARQRTAAGA